MGIGSNWARHRGLAAAAALLAASACSKPKRELDAGVQELVVRAAARPPPPRPPVTPSTGAGGYDRHPRASSEGYGYEFADAWESEECAPLAPCDVRNAFARIERALYACHPLAPVAAGSFVGHLELRLDVARDGKVAGSEVLYTSTKSAEFDACVALGFRSAVFQAGDADAVMTVMLRVTKGI